MIVVGRDTKQNLVVTDKRPDEVALLIGDENIAANKKARKYFEMYRFEEADFAEAEADAVKSLEPGGRRSHVTTLGPQILEKNCGSW